VLTVYVDQLTNLCTFVWTFFDKSAVRSKQMFFKEAIEFLGRTLALRWVYFEGKRLTQHKSTCKGSVYWGESSQHDSQKRVKSTTFCCTKVEHLYDSVKLLFKGFDEVKSEMVRHFVYFIKKGVDHVIFNLQLCEFLLIWKFVTCGHVSTDKSSNALLQVVSNRTR